MGAGETAEARPAAAATYAVRLEGPGPGRPRVLAVVRVVRLAVGAMSGWYDEPTTGDLVVRRRDDDRVVLRVDAGTSEEAVTLLASVREQLATLGAREFRAAWGILDPALGVDGPRAGGAR